MKFKCIEPQCICKNQEQFGNGIYCKLNHAPNHVWGKIEGNLVKLEQCNEDKG